MIKIHSFPKFTQFSFIMRVSYLFIFSSVLIVLSEAMNSPFIRSNNPLSRSSLSRRKQFFDQNPEPSKVERERDFPRFKETLVTEDKTSGISKSRDIILKYHENGKFREYRQSLSGYRVKENGKEIKRVDIEQDQTEGVKIWIHKKRSSPDNWIEYKRTTVLKSNGIQYALESTDGANLFRLKPQNSYKFPEDFPVELLDCSFSIARWKDLLAHNEILVPLYGKKQPNGEIFTSSDQVIYNHPAKHQMHGFDHLSRIFTKVPISDREKSTQSVKFRDQEDNFDFRYQLDRNGLSYVRKSDKVLEVQKRGETVKFVEMLDHPSNPSIWIHYDERYGQGIKNEIKRSYLYDEGTFLILLESKNKGRTYEMKSYSVKRADRDDRYSSYYPTANDKTIKLPLNEWKFAIENARQISRLLLDRKISALKNPKPVEKAWSSFLGTSLAKDLLKNMKDPKAGSGTTKKSRLLQIMSWSSLVLALVFTVVLIEDGENEINVR